MENQPGNQAQSKPEKNAQNSPQPQRKPSAIESDYYFDRFEKIGTLASRYVGQAIAQVAYTDMEAFVVSALTLTGNQITPTMQQVCLLDGASQQFITKNQKEINKKYKYTQRYIRDWVKSRLASVTADQYLPLLERWMSQYTDLSAPFTMLQYGDETVLEHCGPNLAAAMQKAYKLDPDLMSNLARECRESRNEYKGHNTGATQENLTRQKFKRCLSSFDSLVRLFSFKKGEAQKAEVLQSIAVANARADALPLPLDELTAQFPSLNVKLFVDSKLATSYDSEAKILYLRTTAEIKEYVERQSEFTTISNDLFMDELRKRGKNLDEMREALSALAGGAAPAAPLSATAVVATPQAVAPAVAAAPVVQAPARRAIRKPLPALLAYTGGHLNIAQQQELGKQCIVIADTSCWMSANGRQYLAYAPNRLGKMRLVVDWPTRVELYQRETNVGNRYTPAEIEQAHRARLQMHQMHALGLLRYLARVEQYITSQDNILRMAGLNPEHRFCVLTQDRSFSRQVAACGNALPVSVLPGGECMLPSAARAIVKDFSAADRSDAPTPTAEAPITPSRTQEPVASSTSAPAPAPKSAPPPTPKPTPEPAVQPAPAPTAKTVGVQRQLNKVPVCGAVLRSNSGSTVTLGTKLGEGGEGAVYQAGIPNTVAKIYHKEKLTAERFAKLQYMVAHDPHIPELCWPSALLYDKDNVFVGYLMPQLPVDEGKPGCYYELGRSALAVNKPSVAHGIMKDWNRENLVLLCKEICNIFARMHKAGILMGDVNPRNILLLPSTAAAPKIKLVDCDSYQVGDFVCPVGTQAYTSPEIYVREKTSSPKFENFKRTVEDEQYAIAVLLFKILMLNQSPWAGKNAGSIAEAMRGYNFAYRLNSGNGDKGATGADVPDGPYRMVWNNMPRSVKNLFGDVFANRKSVPIASWISALNSYRSDIRGGRFTSDIVPTRYWDPYTDPEKRFTVDFTCTECGKQTNMPKERYQNCIKYHQPLLCNDCRSVMFRLRQTPANIPVVCVRCNRAYQVNQYDATMIDRGKDRGGHPALCPNCLQEVRARNRGKR